MSKGVHCHTTLSLTVGLLPYDNDCNYFNAGFKKHLRRPEEAR